MKRTTAPVSRRDFLKLTGGTLAVAGLSGFRMPPLDSKIPIGTQMWVVRQEAAEDLAGTLKALADLGYQGVEFADDYFGHEIKDIRMMLDDNGLEVMGNHIFLQSMQGEELSKTLEVNEALGAKNLIVRWLRPEQYANKDALLTLAEEMNAVAAQLRPHGMRVGYHNHAEIFAVHDGEMAWNILADNTDDDVIMQLDTGNAMHAPEPPDVVELMRRNAGRTITAHIKPFSAETPAAYIGQDDIDWKSFIQLAETVGGTECYIIEYEIPGTPPLKALEANIALFKEQVKAA